MLGRFSLAVYLDVCAFFSDLFEAIFTPFTRSFYLSKCKADKTWFVLYFIFEVFSRGSLLFFILRFYLHGDHLAQHDIAGFWCTHLRAFWTTLLPPSPQVLGIYRAILQTAAQWKQVELDRNPTPSGYAFVSIFFHDICGV